VRTLSRACSPTRRLGLFERRDQVRERAVVQPAAALRGGDCQADRQVRLPDPERPEEDDILAPLDKAELMQTLDLSRRSDGRKVKSKSCSCFAVRYYNQERPTQSRLSAAAHPATESCLINNMFEP
jgi:hypothetical protein